MKAKKISNGNIYIHRTLFNTERNWWLIKDNHKRGHIKLDNIYFPKEMIGKKIRFKIEIMEEEEEKNEQ